MKSQQNRIWLVTRPDRLQVVQKIEDTQRSNVVRSVGDVIRHGLDPDEVNAIYAFVKNAQLQRLQVGVATVAASIYTFSQNKKEDEDATVAGQMSGTARQIFFC